MKDPSKCILFYLAVGVAMWKYVLLSNRGIMCYTTKNLQEEGEGTGESEKIVGKRARRRNIYYLVKLQGFDSKFNTWESAQHLANEGYQESIDDFEQSLQALQSIEMI